MNTIIFGGDTSAIRRYGIDAEDIYPKLFGVKKIVRGLFFMLRFPTKIWMNDIGKKMKNHSLIIVFDYPNMVEICREIERKAGDGVRLVLYLWNPMSIYSSKVLNKLSNRWEIWTFDPNDAKLYGLKYAGQFLYDCYLPQHIVTDCDSDLFFIGQDKGRFNFLRKFEKECIYKLNVRTKFIYVDEQKSLKSKEYSRPIPYADMINVAMHSKAILELNQTNQTGLTLRALEALLMHKKLVTNNENIKRYIFSHNADIYMLNDINTGLKDFISQPSKNNSEEMLSPYRFLNWLKRIEDDIQFNDYEF